MNSARSRLFALSLPNLAIVAALVLLTFLFFDRLVFSGLILARGDTFSYFYPYWSARNAALLSGQLPLWSPELFMGVPLLANSQLGTFYPPNVLVAMLNPPDGVRLSILLHAFWMLSGTYLLARATLGVDRLPALLAAGLFAFGGYMGGRVEQINQFQGLSWLPWLLLLLYYVRRQPGRYTLLLMLALALQFFTGHTQTFFISGVALGIYTLCSPHRWRTLAALALAAIGALILAQPQLIPTLELTTVSHRSGGLNQNEATAFSLNPFLAPRGFLPSYDLPIFAEYIAYPGIVGLGLAFAGLFQKLIPGKAFLSRFVRDPRFPWLLLALVGLLFAFGEYTPVYWTLARLPGFNLFRVPARWLVLVALSTAMLAGFGAQVLTTMTWRRRAVAAGCTLLVVLALMLAAQVLTSRSPEPVPATPPTETTLIAWALALGVALTLLIAAGWRRVTRIIPLLLVIVALGELWLAARALPYNQLVPPDVVEGQRFTISQMRVYAGHEQPPGRLLAISGLFFDPGDNAALLARFHRLGMSDAEIRTALVAIKQQETLSANLPLMWGIPTIDGFDGGVLPTRYYSAFVSLMMPPDTLRTIDGRLREILAREDCRGACIPDPRWLDLSNTRYLLTDKVYDVWHEDVAYDTTFSPTLEAGETVTARPQPLFMATHVDVMFVGVVQPRLSVSSEEGGVIPLRSGETIAELDGVTIARYSLPLPLAPASIVVRAGAGASPVEIRALTLVDTRTDDFQQVTLGDWTRILSSDVEVYENHVVLPRAFVVFDAQFVTDDDVGTEQMLDIMREPSFDPALSLVIAGDVGANELPVGDGDAQVRITAYEAERVRVEVESDAPGYLVLTDAYYPGWQASIGGESVPIFRADVMFRAVPIPAGQSEVVFEYRPAWLTWLPLALLAWAIAIIVALVALRRKP